MAQTTSELWKTLLRTRNVGTEYAFDINGTWYDSESDAEVSHSVESSLFSEMGIGNVTTAKLSLKIYADDIPRAAKIKRYVRLINGDTVSEWLQKGVFFTSRRAVDDDLWSIDAYDAMRKAEAVWVPDQSLFFPMSMAEAIQHIAEAMGVEIDPRTELIEDEDYSVDYPASDQTMRQTLCWIAAAHGGNWIFTGRWNEETGKPYMRLVPLLPTGTAHEVGLDLVSLNDNGARPPISRVTLWVDDDTCYTAGDDTGCEIVADCPYATKAMVDALAASLRGFVYQAYTADAVAVDPAVELGDPVVVGELQSFVAAISDNGSGYPNISAPGEQEMDDDYPDAGPMQKEFERKIASTRAEIKKTVDSITLSVTNDEDGTSSTFELKAGDAVLSSGKITFDGLVSFQGLEAGTTVINGGCIQTGVLKSTDGETFVLDLDKGIVTMRSSGRFQSTDGNSYISIEGDELVLYALDESSGEYIDKLRLGFIPGSNTSGNGTLDYPYMLFGKSDSSEVGLIKKFINGFWVGNSAPLNESGNFEGYTGAAGIFVNTQTGKTYVVNGTSMQNVYTGAAIAKFK